MLGIGHILSVLDCPVAGQLVLSFVGNAASIASLQTCNSRVSRLLQCNIAAPQGGIPVVLVTSSAKEIIVSAHGEVGLSHSEDESHYCYFGEVVDLITSPSNISSQSPYGYFGDFIDLTGSSDEQ
jgi:hypothetical protein